MGVLCVFPIQEFPTKLAEHFVFLSLKPQPFVFILPCLRELVCFFLVGAGVSDALLISLSSVDYFPPKKDYSEPCTCFPFDILLWLMF